MKIAAGFMVLFFLFATCVQINDPDSLLWMGFYAVATLGSILAFSHLKYKPYIYLGISIFSLFFFSWKFYVIFTDSLAITNAEHLSELGGTSIVISWFLILSLRPDLRLQLNKSEN